MDFLEKLLEGSREDESFVGEAIDVDETGLSTSALIETACTDLKIGVLAAEEAFEMACIVGGAQVVSEGTGQQGASILLEGAIKNFFNMIAEKVKKFVEWIKGLWRKITGRAKTDGKQVQAEFKKVEKAAEQVISSGGTSTASGGGKSAVKLPESITILDIDNGEKKVTDMISYTRDALNQFDEMMNIIKSGDISKVDDEKMVIHTKNQYGENKDWKANQMLANGEEGLEGKLKVIVKDPSVKDMSSFTAYIRRCYGIGSQKKAEADFTKADLATMRKVVDLAGSSDIANANAICEGVTTRCNNIIKVCKEYANSDDGAVDAVSAGNGNAIAGVKKIVSSVTKEINEIGNILTTLVNERSIIILNAAKSYTSFVKSVASKGTTKAAQDAVDYSIYFEACDVVDEECDPDEGCESDDGEMEEEGCKTKMESFNSFLSL